MISYYYYWQALRRTEESLKTIIAMRPDVPPMVEAQHEMNEMELAFWREEAEKFTRNFLIFIMFVVIMFTLYYRGLLHVFQIG
jgi:hypothetical protein